MQVMELKIILERSNPSIIRQFTLPLQAKAKQLKEIIPLLMNWNLSSNEMFVTKITLRNQIKELKETDSVRDAFLEDSVLYYKVGVNAISFRVIFLGEKEQEEEYPLLIRWHGFNLPQNIDNIVSFNKLQLWWSTKDRRYYNYKHYMYFDYEDVVFSPKTVSLALKKYYMLEERGIEPVSIELDYSYAGDMKDNFRHLKIDEIKQRAVKEGIYLEKGLKKEQLIHSLVEGLFQLSVFEKKINCMTLAEYRTFKSFCMGERSFNQYLTLSLLNRFSESGFISSFIFYGYDYNMDATNELLELYEEWLNDGKENEFLKKAEVYTAISGCVKLYGYIKREDWLKISTVWFSKKWTQEQLKEMWQEYFTYCADVENSFIMCKMPDILFYKNELNQEVVSMIEKKSRIYYQPAFKELEKIDSDGLCFEAAEQRELNRILNRMVFHESEVEEVSSAIYSLIRCNYDKKDFMAYFHNSFQYMRNNILNELWNMIEKKLRTKVRQIGLGGYTEEEYSSVLKKMNPAIQKENKKIYPNDLCPCGSGKKYKFCHGVSKT